jgi:1,3-beta-glucan synthase
MLDWENFFKDTMILAEGRRCSTEVRSQMMRRAGQRPTIYPFTLLIQECRTHVNYLRTRTWASLQAQTHYRTVSGMMNYSKAIKLLYRVENLEAAQLLAGAHGPIEIQNRRLRAMVFQIQQEHENLECCYAHALISKSHASRKNRAKKEGFDPRIFLCSDQWSQ